MQEIKKFKIFLLAQDWPLKTVLNMYRCVTINFFSKKVIYMSLLLEDKEKHFI